MKVNLIRKNGENFLAIILTLVVIGLLFVLKSQEDNYKKINENRISMGSHLITD